MKKIRLELERLEVSSFETRRTPDERGTVRGHNRATQDGAYTCFYHCTWNHNTCNEEATCAQPGTNQCTLNATCRC